MQISSKLILAFNIAAIVVSALAAGSLWHPHWMSADTADDIHQGCSFSLPILLSIRALFTARGSEPILSPPKSIVLALLAGGIALMLLMPGHAEAAPRHARAVPAPPKKPVASLFGGATSLQSPDQIIDKIRLWATTDAGADLDAAIAVGTVAQNPVTVPCFKAIRSFVTIVQSLPTADKLPKLHLAVDIEILTDLEIDLLPNSPIITSCTALANFQAISAQNLVTGIVSGALALSKFAPVVPAI